MCELKDTLMHRYETNDEVQACDGQRNWQQLNQGTTEKETYILAPIIINNKGETTAIQKSIDVRWN